MSSAGIERDQDEARQMTVNLRPMPYSLAIPTERTSKESGNFTTVEVALTGFGLGRERDRNEAINFRFFPAPSKGRTQNDEFAAGGCFRYRLAILFGTRIDLFYAPANVCIAAYASYGRNRLIAEELNELKAERQFYGRPIFNKL